MTYSHEPRADPADGIVPTDPRNDSPARAEPIRARAVAPHSPKRVRCPHPGQPGYDPNPTVVGRPCDDETYHRYAASLDLWHQGWWWDDLGRMVAGLQREARWRREADPEGPPDEVTR